MASVPQGEPRSEVADVASGVVDASGCPVALTGVTDVDAAAALRDCEGEARVDDGVTDAGALPTGFVVVAPVVLVVVAFEVEGPDEVVVVAFGDVADGLNVVGLDVGVFVDVVAVGLAVDVVAVGLGAGADGVHGGGVDELPQFQASTSPASARCEAGPTPEYCQDEPDQSQYVQYDCSDALSGHVEGTELI